MKRLLVSWLVLFLLHRVLLVSGGWTPNARAAAQPPPPHSPRLERSPDWSGPDSAGIAALTPDLSTAGQDAVVPDYPSYVYWTRVAFQGVADNHWEIFWGDGSGQTSPTRPAPSSAPNYAPRLSLDANTIVFSSLRDGNSEIYRVNTDGSGLARLTADPAADGEADWSPDGGQIVFVSDRGGAPAIYRMNSAGGTALQLTNPSGKDFNPVFSPDGKLIAWVRVNAQNIGRVWVMDASGANQHSLTGDLAAPDRVAWSPDGQNLAVDADLDGDGWIDVGWFPAAGGSLQNFCDQPWGNDCWLGSWYGTDQEILYSTIFYYHDPSGQLIITGTYLVRHDITGPISSGSTVSFRGYSSMLVNGDAQPRDRSIPASALQPLPRYLPVNQVGLSWDGLDAGPAGIYGYSIYQKTDPKGDWSAVPSNSYWQNQFDESGLHHTVLPAETPGQTLYLASRARDLAEHFEPLPRVADTLTTTYAQRTQLQVSDNRGQALPGVSLQGSAPILNAEALRSDASGQAAAYHAANVGQSFQVGSFPAVAAALNQDRSLQLVLAPRANLLENGTFENGLANWQAGGVVNVETSGHSGDAARLGAYCPLPCQTAPEEFVKVYNPSLQMVVDSQLSAHLLVGGRDYWTRDAQGTWRHPDQPFGVPGRQITALMRLDGQDTLHVLYGTLWGMIYYQKPLAGDWRNLEYVDFYPTYQYYPLDGLMDVGQQGQVHVVYHDPGQYPYYYYLRRESGGGWSLPLLLPRKVNALAAAADGGAYLFYGGQMQHISPTGVLNSPIWLDGCDVTHAQSTGQGQVQLICAGPPIEYRVLGAAGGWIVKQLLGDFNPWAVFFSRDGGAALYTKRDYNDRNVQILSKQVDSQEFDYVDYETGQFGIDRGELALAMSSQDGLHVAASGIASAFYNLSQSAAQAQDASLSQTVTVPAGMNQPTLSFLYQLQGLARLDRSGLTVTLTTAENSTTGLYGGKMVGPWTHAWADLSPWAGQTVTLTFRYHQAGGEPVSSLLLDEIQVGAWETPRLQAVDPAAVAEWSSGQSKVAIYGSNFVEGDAVEVDGQVVAAGLVSGGELSFQVPGSLKTGDHGIKVLSPGGIPSNELTLRLGYVLFLPEVVR